MKNCPLRRSRLCPQPLSSAPTVQLASDNICHSYFIAMTSDIYINRLFLSVAIVCAGAILVFTAQLHQKQPIFTANGLIEIPRIRVTISIDHIINGIRVAFLFAVLYISRQVWLRSKWYWFSAAVNCFGDTSRDARIVAYKCRLENLKTMKLERMDDYYI